MFIVHRIDEPLGQGDALALAGLAARFQPYDCKRRDGCKHREPAIDGVRDMPLNIPAMLACDPDQRAEQEAAAFPAAC